MQRYIRGVRQMLSAASPNIMAAAPLHRNDAAQTIPVHVDQSYSYIPKRAAIVVGLKSKSIVLNNSLAQKKRNLSQIRNISRIEEVCCPFYSNFETLSP